MKAALHPRMVPVDLARCLAAYGVVVMHTSFVAGSTPSDSAYFFQKLFIFAVPFFLAAAFYFTKLPGTPADLRHSFAQRATRLLLPYVFWTALYLAARLAKYIATGNLPKITETFCSDPLGLALMGGAAVHLYFLPLLLLGTALMLALAPLLRASSLPVLALLFTASVLLNIFAYEALFSVGFSASPLPWSEGWAAGWLASGKRFLYFTGACLVRCFPYICFAVLLRTWLGSGPISTRGKTAGILAGLLFAALAVYSAAELPLQGFPGSLWEIIMGFGPLLLALAFSRALSSQSWISKMGELSFGIYLSHHLLMEALQLAAGKALPLSIQGSLPWFAGLTLACFFLSALLMLGVSRLGAWPRLLCGMR